jgi:uncharacterized protein YdaU (DUF1376 family)
MPSRTDIWMPLYIGDYLADTSHLDAERHGCYLLWMMHYWRKGPLPNDSDELINLGRLRSINAPSIVRALLKEFFTLNDQDGLWHQKRQDSERAKWQERKERATEKATAAASSRWKGHAPSNAPIDAKPLLEPCPSPSPSSSPVSSPEPPPENSVATPQSAEPTADPVPYSEFQRIWNDHRGKLPAVVALTDGRKRKIKARVIQGLTVETFLQAVECCRVKPFLSGDNDRGWTATFDWLIANSENVEKAIENPYGSNARGGNANGKRNANGKSADDVLRDLEAEAGANSPGGESATRDAGQARKPGDDAALGPDLDSFSF